MIIAGLLFAVFLKKTHAMSIRNMNIAPRAFLGFVFIALLVIVLGFFAVNRMSMIRQATTDMETNMLPSVGFLGDMTENALRLRITSFRMFVNREPEVLKQTDECVYELTEKLQKSIESYESLPAQNEEKQLTRQFDATFKSFLVIQQQVLDFSHQGKLDDMLRLLNTGFKECTDLMSEQINKLVQINAATTER